MSLKRGLGRQPHRSPISAKKSKFQSRARRALRLKRVIQEKQHKTALAQFECGCLACVREKMLSAASLLFLYNPSGEASRVLALLLLDDPSGDAALPDYFLF